MLSPMTPTTNYIGLACTGHDNAIAIVGPDGELRFAEAAERYLQNKRSINSPPDDLIRTEQLIDEHCDPGAKLVVATSWSGRAAGILDAEDVYVAELLEQARAIGLLPRALEVLEEYRHTLALMRRSIEYAGSGVAYSRIWERSGRPQEIVRAAYDHHLTHAAAGCLSSPFDEAVCAIVDGFGEGTSCSYYVYRDGMLEPIEQPRRKPGDMGRSLGVFYRDLCRWCGFHPWKGEEWKVMGLAAYGKRDDRLHGLMRQCIAVDGLRIIHPADATEAALELAGMTRAPSTPVIEAADLAHTGQIVFCELMRELLSNLHGLGHSGNLVLGGGCALNSAWNGRILAETAFEQLHVQSAPGDDGTALGAALLAYREHDAGATPHASWRSPYLGSTMAETTLERMDALGRIPNSSVWPGNVHEQAARLLADGKIIGWVQGRAEFGPRALGNRSILADPRPSDMKDRINAAVKFREEYRPFAPAILHESGAEYFVDYRESPYMERTLRFAEPLRGRVPAVVHADGTGRVQSVTRESNSKFYDLIRAFEKITGVPLVLNTSFNVMGKPIIHSVEDALGVFYTTGLDALVIGDRLIVKDS
jgi:carbamoyltransferase